MWSIIDDISQVMWELVMNDSIRGRNILDLAIDIELCETHKIPLESNNISERKLCPECVAEALASSEVIKWDGEKWV